jgi:hypothetical protein
MAQLELTKQQLQDCWTIWISDSSLRSELRFGQYVYNKFAVSGVTDPWPALFYEKNNAYSMLYVIAKDS